MQQISVKQEKAELDEGLMVKAFRDEDTEYMNKGFAIGNGLTNPTIWYRPYTDYEGGRGKVGRTAGQNQELVYTNSGFDFSPCSWKFTDQKHTLCPTRSVGTPARYGGYTKKFVGL
ncbi:unnamed protein product [Lactuca virosa]|uniref:Uncharacterized protein n=1 Tax=Lactuca virosa TaxID=75947 RepID=A0AAU9MT35_9ASTR|nr:unnamed protein product [Lactuca virosa]